MSDQDPLFLDSTEFRARRLHLSVTGSVAAYRAATLLRAWRKTDIHVSVTLSHGAQQFVTPMLFEALGAMPVYSDLSAREQDCFAHLEPGQMASAMMIAPASANTLSKLATGSASDLVSAQALAFAGPLVIAPAMNPKMWAHPAVQANVRILEERGARIVVPESGSCACGDTGQGRLADVPALFLEGLRALSPSDMAGKKVLVTLGPTREYWDFVRFWSNPSSGRMGFSLAIAAWLRGAEVHAVCGPSAFSAPGIRRHDVQSAQEMYDAANDLWPDMDYGMFSAAVADFAPVAKEPGCGKTKKHTLPDEFQISFRKNPDILMQLSSQRRKGQKILAFAAETADDEESLLALAREKRARKGADLLAANRVNAQNSGFISALNKMAVVDARGREEIWPSLSKADVAWRLCSWLLKS